MDRTVALFGKSLAIDSIAAALDGIQGLTVLRLGCSLGEGVRSLQALAPDAVIFDIASEPRDLPFLDLMARQGLLLVGFDLAAQRMLLISGECARFATLSDLLRIVSVRDDRQEPEDAASGAG
jgi:hypothetical protein